MSHFNHACLYEKSFMAALKVSCMEKILTPLLSYYVFIKPCSIHYILEIAKIGVVTFAYTNLKIMKCSFSSQTY